MKSFIAAMLFCLPLAASATELIKLLDGSLAKCESKIDVARYNFSGVYRPVSIMNVGNKTVIEIELLSCLEEKSKFGFQREVSFENRSIKPILSPDRVFLMERSNLTLLITNDHGKVIDRQKLTKVRGAIYRVEVSLETEDYDDLPEGKNSLIMNLSSKFKLTDSETDEIVDQGRITYGGYRLIIK